MAAANPAAVLRCCTDQLVDRRRSSLRSRRFWRSTASTRPSAVGARASSERSFATRSSRFPIFIRSRAVNVRSTPQSVAMGLA